MAGKPIHQQLLGEWCRRQLPLPGESLQEVCTHVPFLSDLKDCTAFRTVHSPATKQSDHVFGIACHACHICLCAAQENRELKRREKEYHDNVISKYYAEQHHIDAAAQRATKDDLHRREREAKERKVIQDLMQSIHQVGYNI
jgi:hypothetical protein